MKRVETKLDDAVVARIEASGMSTYQFLQEAVELKLNSDKAIKVEVLIARSMKEHGGELEKMLLQYRNDMERLFEAKVDRLEERMIAVVNISHKLLNESIEKDESFKARTIENLKRITEIAKGQK